MELEWPIVHEKCPVCGSEETIGKIIAQQEREKGKIGEEVVPCLFQQTAMIADPRRLTATLSAPVVTSMYDVCANPECGACYCVYANLSQATTKASMPQGGPGNLPFGSNNPRAS